MPTTESDPRRSQAQALAQRLNDDLAPNGWKVSLEVSQWGLHFHFVHPLAGDTRLSLLSTNTKYQDWTVAEKEVFAFLAQPEFQLIADRPTKIGDANLIRSLRSAISSFRWTKTHVGQVTEMLQWAGLMSVEEADWLQRAGAPFLGWIEEPTTI